MKVRELITALNEMDPDLPVLFKREGHAGLSSVGKDGLTKSKVAHDFDDPTILLEAHGANGRAIDALLIR